MYGPIRLYKERSPIPHPACGRCGAYLGKPNASLSSARRLDYWLPHYYFFWKKDRRTLLEGYRSNQNSCFASRFLQNALSLLLFYPPYRTCSYRPGNAQVSAALEEMANVYQYSALHDWFSIRLLQLYAGSGDVCSRLCGLRNWGSRLTAL